MASIRLQKFLSQAGLCSRRQGEVYIRNGCISVNGRVVTEMGIRIDPARDRVAFQGRPVAVEAGRVYIALHKPAGVVTSCRQKNARVVLDLIDIAQHVIPIGRLDKASTGLILLTNDRRLHHQLLHPSFDHEKEYVVTTSQPISDTALKKLAGGLPLMGRPTRPAAVRRISEKRFCIVLQEGRNRQIRRMVRKVGGHVEQLKRIRFAHIRLGKLPEGAWRYLKSKEIEELLEAAGRLRGTEERR